MSSPCNNMSRHSHVSKCHFVFAMCYYRLYIFVGCGHSTSSDAPVGYCKDARRKKEERAKVPMASQDRDTEPGGGCRCTDSQTTLLPDDDSEGRANVTITCGDASKLLHPGISMSEDRRQDTQSMPTTHVPLHLISDEWPVSLPSPPPITIQEGHTPPSYLRTTGNDTVEPCGDGRVHPLHTIRLDRICSACECERERRLRALYSSMREVKTDPTRWHWKYQGNMNRKSAENQRAGMGWSAGVGAAVGEWWDRGKKENRNETR